MVVAVVRRLRVSQMVVTLIFESLNIQTHATKPTELHRSGMDNIDKQSIILFKYIWFGPFLVVFSA